MADKEKNEIQISEAPSSAVEIISDENETGLVLNKVISFFSGTIQEVHDVVFKQEIKNTINSVAKFISYRKGVGLMKRFAEAINDRVEKGEFSKEDCSTENAKNYFETVTEYIENRTPNHIKYEAIQAIFMSAMKNIDTADVLPKTYLNILFNLSDNALIILFTNYKLIKGDKMVWSRSGSIDAWASTIASSCSFAGIKEIVFNHENELVDNHLIAERTGSNGQVLGNANSFRMTDLGIKMCEFIESDDPEIFKKVSNLVEV